MMRDEARQRVREMLAKLADEDREILIQRFLEQLPSKEIAEILGISVGAARMRLCRALQRLQRLLDLPASEA